MPYYESVFLARPDISSAQVDNLTETFKSIVGEKGGSVTKTEYWGLKNLAYRIKKNRKAHYALMNLDAPAEAVTEMERSMRLNEDVLRFMTIRVDEPEEGPSAMMRAKSSREERGRRSDRDRQERGQKDKEKDKERESEKSSRDEPASAQAEGDEK